MHQNVQRIGPRVGSFSVGVEVLEGPTGRRTWPEALKGQIVAETLAPGARVCEVARRYRARAQQVTTWRKQAREGKLALPPEGSAPIPGFADVALCAGEERLDRAVMIEIQTGSVTLRLPSATSAAWIAEIVLALRSGA